MKQSPETKKIYDCIVSAIQSLGNGRGYLLEARTHSDLQRVVRELERSRDYVEAARLGSVKLLVTRRG